MAEVRTQFKIEGAQRVVGDIRKTERAMTNYANSIRTAQSASTKLTAVFNTISSSSRKTKADVDRLSKSVTGLKTGIPTVAGPEATRGITGMGVAAGVTAGQITGVTAAMGATNAAIIGSAAAVGGASASMAGFDVTLKQTEADLVNIMTAMMGEDDTVLALTESIEEQERVIADWQQGIKDTEKYVNDLTESYDELDDEMKQFVKDTTTQMADHNKTMKEKIGIAKKDVEQDKKSLKIAQQKQAALKKTRVETQKLSAAQRATKASTTGLSGAFGKLKNVAGMLGIVVGVAGLIRVFKGVKDSIIDTIKASAEQEQIFLRLETQLNILGINYDQQENRIRDFLGAMQDLTVHGDTELAPVISLLAAITGDLNNALYGTKLAAELAASFEMDLATAARLVGRTIEGDVTVWSRYGLAVTETALKAKGFKTQTEKVEYVLGLLEEKTKDISFALKITLLGAIEGVKNEFGDWIELLGDPAIDDLQDMLYNLTFVMRGLIVVTAEFQGWVQKNIGSFKEIILLLFEGISMIPMFGKVFRILTTNISLALNKLAEIGALTVPTLEDLSLNLSNLGGDVEVTKEKLEELVITVDALRWTIQTMEQLMPQIGTTMDKVGFRIAQGMGNAVESLIVNMNESTKVFKEFGKVAMQVLRQVIAQLIATAAKAALLKLLFPGTFEASGGFGEVFKFLFAQGGKVPAYAQQGMLQRGTDTIPIMASPGEMVIPAKVVRESQTEIGELMRGRKRKGFGDTVNYNIYYPILTSQRHFDEMVEKSHRERAYA